MKKFYFLAIIVILFSVYIGCKKDDSSENPTPPKYTNGEGEIGEIGGIIEVTNQNSSLFGAEINIPAEALENPVTISISKSISISEDFFFDENNVIVHCEPVGQTFKLPVQVKIPFNGTFNENTKVLFLNEELNEVIEIPIISNSNGYVLFETDHFSDYIATKRGVSCSFDMFKIDGKVGVKINLFESETEDYFNIPTAFSHKIKYPFDIVINDVYNNNDIGIYDKQSFYTVTLLKGDGYKKYPIETLKIGARMQIGSGTMNYAIVYKDDQNNGLYSSPWSSDFHDFGEYFDAAALVFKFAYPIDETEKYYVIVHWALAQTHNYGYTYTRNYYLSNYKNRQLFNTLETQNIDSNNDYVNDNYQEQTPICNFEADLTTVQQGQTISFSDLSTNSPTSWSWNFDDGSTSTQKNPTHSYSTQGNYTVSLEVSNQHGSNTKTIENYIQVTIGSFIEVITPNGNEEWQLGTTHELTWDDNITENVKIQLWNGSTLATNIATSTSSDGSFTWNMTNGYDISNNYKIKIISTNNSSISDESDNSFSIVEVGNIQVTNPNSSTTWTMGQYNVPISWETGNLGGTVTIQMYKGSNKLATLTPNTTNNGTYNEYDIQTTLAEGDDYRIKVISNTNSDKYDYSEYFTINEATNLPPTIPQDEYPLNGATDVEINDAIFWTSTDPENDPLTYDIYFGTSTNPPLFVSDETDNYYSLTDLNANANTTYYWKIVVKDDHSNSTEGSIWNFTTQSGGNDDLVAYYPFNGNANDESGNGNDGQIDEAILTYDRFNNNNSAYQFNDPSAIRVSNMFDIQLRSITAWVKADFFPTGNIYKVVLTNDGNNSGKQYGSFNIVTADNNSFRLSACGSNTYLLNNASSEVWYFFCLVTDGSYNYYYVNGNLVGTTVANNVCSNSANGHFRIGEHRDQNSLHYFTGKVDDVRIFNSVINSDMILSLYNEDKKTR